MAVEPKRWWASRKFWVGAIMFVLKLLEPVTGIALPVEALTTGLVYMGAEGLADAAGAYGRGKASGR